MPDVFAPFQTATMGEAAWFRDRGYIDPTGVHGPPGATPAAGDLGCTTNGLTLSLALGRAHVRGAYYERTGTAWTYTTPANTNPTLARVDRVVLRRDLAARTVTPAVLQGTPAATPTPPALTQTEDGVWESSLFLSTVPAASGTVLTVADDRPWIMPDSGRLVLPRLFAYATVARTGFPAGWQDLDLNAETIDTHNVHATGAALAVGQRYFTVPAGHAGRYKVGGGAVFGTVPQGSVVNARIMRNSAVFQGCTGGTASATVVGWSVVTGEKILDLAVGDTVHVQGYCASGGGLWDTGVFADGASWLAVERID